MAHYDCSNCGEYLGIDFGYCRSCTPKEFTTLQDERAEIILAAEAAWKKEMADTLRRIENARKGWIEATTRIAVAKIDARLHEIQMEYDNSYRRQHERDGGA